MTSPADLAPAPVRRTLTDRITQLADSGGSIADSDWIGSSLRELRRVNRNGTQLTFLNDAGNQDLGFDAVQRITRLRVLGAGGPGAPIVDREYGYNRASQRTFEKRNDDHGLTDRYTYDSSYRIVASSFDQDGLPGAMARDLSQVGYRYDGVGNRRDVSKTTTSIGVLAESYGVNALNQYTSVAGVTRDHDDNGNLVDDGSKLFTFDYKNRLVGAQRKSDSAPIALYSYLADGRRVRKQAWNPDGGAVVRDTRFVLDGAQEVEEQDWSSGATTTTYVWSPVYVDELVEFTNASGSFFTHQDARCDVVAVTNAAGAVVERRRFDDFGRAEVRDAGGAVVAASPSGCEYGFQGRRLDPETGLVFFRARYYSPETGRFVQRDPVWDAGNVGGQYTFCGNDPYTKRDPLGLQTHWPVGDARHPKSDLDRKQHEQETGIAEVHRDRLGPMPPPTSPQTPPRSPPPSRVPFDLKNLGGHRNDPELKKLLDGAERNGYKCYIGDTGKADAITYLEERSIVVGLKPGEDSSSILSEFVHELHHANYDPPPTPNDGERREDFVNRYLEAALQDEVRAYYETPRFMRRMAERLNLPCYVEDPFRYINEDPNLTEAEKKAKLREAINAVGQYNTQFTGEGNRAYDEYERRKGIRR